MASKPSASATDIAELLGITRPRVYELVSQPDDPLPAFRLGERQLRFDLDEVEAWLDARRTSRPEPAPAR